MASLKSLSFWSGLGSRIGFFQKNITSFSRAVPSASSHSTFTNKIAVPEYVLTGKVTKPARIQLNTSDEILRIKESCQIVKEVFELIEKNLLTPGTTGLEIDDHVREFIISKGAYPSPLGFHGYPKSCTVCPNNIAAHAIPTARPLAKGDVVSIDISVYLNGFHGDSCRTFVIKGDSKDKADYTRQQKLVTFAERCRNSAIELCGPGVSIIEVARRISSLIQNSSSPYSVADIFCGHGVGRYFHEPPMIHHVLDENHNDYLSSIVMQPGMVFTVEPVICEGACGEVSFLEDGWTAITCDEDVWSGQFEHTIVITEDGHEILT